MNPRETELLQGMGNCYNACGASFEETLEMVGSNRGLTPDEVKEMLLSIRTRFGDDPEYLRLRARFPADFSC